MDEIDLSIFRKHFSPVAQCGFVEGVFRNWTLFDHRRCWEGDRDGKNAVRILYQMPGAVGSKIPYTHVCTWGCFCVAFRVTAAFLSWTYMIHTSLCKHKQTQDTHARTCTHAHASVHTHSFSLSYICTHTPSYTYVHSHTHTHTRTNTQTRTNIHTYTHTENTCFWLNLMSTFPLIHQHMRMSCNRTNSFFNDKHPCTLFNAWYRISNAVLGAGMWHQKREVWKGPKEERGRKVRIFLRVCACACACFHHIFLMSSNLPAGLCICCQKRKILSSRNCIIFCIFGTFLPTRIFQMHSQKQHLLTSRNQSLCYEYIFRFVNVSISLLTPVAVSIFQPLSTRSIQRFHFENGLISRFYLVPNPSKLVGKDFQ